MANKYFDLKKTYYISYSSSGKEHLAFGAASSKEGAEDSFKKYFDENCSIKEIMTQEEYVQKVSKELSHKMIRDFVLKNN